MKLFLFVCFCVSATVVAYDPSTVCKTPNGETASCILLFKCPILVKAAANDDPIVTEFIEASACGRDKFMVCCGTSATYVKKQTRFQLPDKPNKEDELAKKESRKFALENYLPGRVYCGFQHTDDYIYNKEETSVDEFPWMVYIPTETYIRDFYLRVKDHCVGALISNRYVLTHKDCNSLSVLIGQHQIYKDVSCIDTPYDIVDCTNPLLNEFTDDYISSKTHNFALLRLQTKISFSDFVRPICLPLENDESPEAGDVISTSGWGEQQKQHGKNVKLKKRVKHTMLAKEECENGNPVPNPICGERFQNSTSYVCPVDKGGPLMYRHKTGKLNWVTLGMITENSSCAKHRPVVAERITPDVVNWILDNLKP